jgi:hypothetical protein
MADEMNDCAYSTVAATTNCSSFIHNLRRWWSGSSMEASPAVSCVKHVAYDQNYLHLHLAPAANCHEHLETAASAPQAGV